MKNDSEAFVCYQFDCAQTAADYQTLAGRRYIRMTIVDEIETYSPGGHHHTDDHGVDC